MLAVYSRRDLGIRHRLDRLGDDRHDGANPVIANLPSYLFLWPVPLDHWLYSRDGGVAWPSGHILDLGRMRMADFVDCARLSRTASSEAAFTGPKTVPVSCDHRRTCSRRRRSGSDTVSSRCQTGDSFSRWEKARMRAILLKPVVVLGLHARPPIC